MARNPTQILADVRRYLPTDEFDCDFGTCGSALCAACHPDTSRTAVEAMKTLIAEIDEVTIAASADAAAGKFSEAFTVDGSTCTRTCCLWDDRARPAGIYKQTLRKTTLGKVTGSARIHGIRTGLLIDLGKPDFKVPILIDTPASKRAFGGSRSMVWVVEAMERLGDYHGA